MYGYEYMFALQNLEKSGLIKANTSSNVTSFFAAGGVSSGLLSALRASALCLALRVTETLARRRLLQQLARQ